MSIENTVTKLDELRKTGMTILQSVVPEDVVGALRESVMRDRLFLEETKKSDLYRISSVLASPAHIGFMLPLSTPYCDNSILSGDAFYELLEGYLGEGFYLHEYVCNVALANSHSKQLPHPDQEFDLRGPIGIVCNLAIEKTGISNGMTNLFPNTHKNIINLSKDIYSYSSIQPNLEPGDMLIRDISLIHQGVGNPSALDRYLLALVFKPKWEKISEYAINNVSRTFFEKSSDKVKNLLRYHKLGSNENSLPKTYPQPKEEFSDGY